ncbi:DUF3592 domain-containing protein [Micromonospora musae]|uniref:DUF3592 domain-containing protein n=1 Tax=Micromonospora musae TaxID=1894970 RepID=A0A3A9Y5P0_9ACTN|nr:DUF3592 domain-containing protein [Micromonospora musae]RKN15686.1 DUF3592 domain-containing protein [Micromonospora musae]RKN29124.1 DUF3592 domain-containing protein [Micromonospora musae]
MANQIFRRVAGILTGRAARTAAGATLVADGLVGIDVPGGRRRTGIVGSLVVVAVGLLFVGLGWWWHGQHQPYPDGTSATATVTRITTSRDSDGRTMYSRVLTFTASNNQPVEFTEPESSTNRPTIGSTATVSYRPQDPGSARVIPETDWIPYGMIALGALAALIGAVTFLVRLVTLVAGIYLLASAARRRVGG